MNTLTKGEQRLLVAMYEHGVRIATHIRAMAAVIEKRKQSGQSLGNAVLTEMILEKREMKFANTFMFHQLLGLGVYQREENLYKVVKKLEGLMLIERQDVPLNKKAHRCAKWLAKRYFPSCDRVPRNLKFISLTPIGLACGFALSGN
jgi:hypothetical protein